MHIILKKQAVCLKTDFFHFLQFIGTLAIFHASFENLPQAAKFEFVLVNKRTGERRVLNSVVTAGELRVFYTLYTSGSYRILFIINNVLELALSVKGLGMS